MDLGLVALARIAGVSRQTARTCVRRGLLEGPPYRPEDAALLKVCATCLDYRPSGLDLDNLSLRDSQAISLARGFLARKDRPAEAIIVLSENTARLALTLPTLVSLLGASGAKPCVLLPVGVWVHSIVHSLLPR
jgi:hypothetical protein